MAQQTCSRCSGRGTVEMPCPISHDLKDDYGNYTACYRCNGTGRVQERCDVCGGSGYVDDGRSESSFSSNIYDSIHGSSSSTPSSSGGGVKSIGDRFLAAQKQAFASYSNNDIDNALKLCNDALEMFKPYYNYGSPKMNDYYAKFIAQTFNLLGVCCNEKGNRTGAIYNFKIAVLWGNEDAQKNLDNMGIQNEAQKGLSNLQEADQLFNAGNYDKAIMKYSLASRQGNNKAIALMKRAACYAKKGDKDQAKDDYNSAINEGGLSKSELDTAKAELAKLK